MRVADFIIMDTGYMYRKIINVICNNIMICGIWTLHKFK